jgi:hypothetical protein
VKRAPLLLRLGFASCMHRGWMALVLLSRRCPPALRRLVITSLPVNPSSSTRRATPPSSSSDACTTSTARMTSLSNQRRTNERTPERNGTEYRNIPLIAAYIRPYYFPTQLVFGPTTTHRIGLITTLLSTFTLVSLSATRLEIQNQRIASNPLLRYYYLYPFRLFFPPFV